MASHHVVVDGSNIATEGRSLPSLKQLDEAVRAFLKERPHDTATIVVDATFEHRIDSSERSMYDGALEAGELITPPAGTIGRGDKFLLEIADRSHATVFSNDSFQEFHGEYEWLFDEGRLIGGKPVPEVGWIFIPRTPVRGPKSRMATRAASKSRVRTGRVSAAPTSPLANEPLPAPAFPPPAPAPSRRRAAAAVAPVEEPSEVGAPETDSPARARRRPRPAAAEPVNEPLPFIEFIAEHPVGSTVDGEVDEFASHGAYVLVGGARCYLALKFMGDPPPRSARELLSRGEVRPFVVQSIDAPRRGIDLAMPGFEEVDASLVAPIDADEEGEEGEEDEPESEAPPPAKATRSRRTTKAAANAAPGAPAPDDETPVPAKAATRKKAPAKKAATIKKAPAEKGVEAPTDDAALTEAPATTTTAKRVTKKATPTEAPTAEAPTTKAAPAKRATKATKKASEAPAESTDEAADATTAEPVGAKKVAARRVTKEAAEATDETATEPEAAKAPAKKRATAKKAPAKKKAIKKVAKATEETPTEPEATEATAAKKAVKAVKATRKKKAAAES